MSQVSQGNESYAMMRSIASGERGQGNPVLHIHEPAADHDVVHFTPGEYADGLPMGVAAASAWSVNRDGERHTGILIHSSPEVQGGDASIASVELVEGQNGILWMGELAIAHPAPSNIHKFDVRYGRFEDFAAAALMAGMVRYVHDSLAAHQSQS